MRQAGSISLVCFWLDSSWRVMGYGDGSDFQLQYGKGPETILITRVVNDSLIEYMIPDGLSVYIDSALVSGGTVNNNDHKVFSYKHLRWFFIERDGFNAIRVRDLDHPKLKDLPELKYFEATLEWRKEGTFNPYYPPQVVEVPNVLGRSTKMKVIGELSFQHEGKNQNLVLFEGSPGRGFFNICGQNQWGGNLRRRKVFISGYPKKW